MHPKSLPSFAPLLFPILLFFINISCEEGCSECKTRSCGEVRDITHPFWFSGEQSPGPPGFEVKCNDSGLPVLVHSIGMSYSILQIFHNNRSLWLNNTKPADDDCAVPNVQFGLDDHFFISTANRELFLFHHCSGTGPENSTPTKCAHDDVYAILGGNYSDFPPPDLSCGCEVLATAPVYIPGGEEESPDRYVDLLKNGFLVEWWDDEGRCGDCRGSGGKCGSDHGTGEFVCHCPQRPDDPSSCSKC
ncbi:hypothetical protein C4D60_Mb03t01300 [Musa balbisiana]|uniref:Wall-associated receptor kinase C-terminal domain-containing protein n=1 Tax=Musa balbisiana TaxID=52838 RepID=A0A4S8J6Q6_MUSBA|nr:hypothetical protein C4D60_Mb03t01300 [Musa balbisiana]